MARRARREETDMTLDDIRRKYAADRFATEAAGVTIVSAEPG